ncbi:hypothetical protein MHF_0886 [Mycoplasma haemofelis Ohio2]|uniref:Uncharacterized protein n=1 Tax=Mycoplasma haemofelis (strain Ohio2) TaxID=859194 RepID=F6FIU6_MYCHI|nr:hypothetical protein MHF_0886 [Mycoplasma haemofelis Ohio2]
MSLLSSLIKLSPAVAAPVIGGGIFAINFQDQNTIQLEEVEYELSSITEAPKPLPQGRAGRQHKARDVRMDYSLTGGSGGCNIYVIQDHEDGGDSLIFRSFQKYDNLESAKQSISPKPTTVEESDRVKCGNGKHIYLYKKFGDTWAWKAGDEAPINNT